MKILRYCVCILLIIEGKQKLQAQCNADFNYSININNLNCYPKDSIAGAIDSWQIQKNGLTSYSDTGYNFYYNASDPGTYMVTHILYDSLNACSDTTTKSITINFTPTCYAGFGATPYPYGIAVFGKEYVFNAEPTTMGSAVLKYSWLVDSIQVSTEKDLYYKFLQQGIHDVCLHIKTASGCEANNCKQVIAYDKCKDSTPLSFTHTADTLFPHTIDFSVSSTQPQTSYFWEAFWMTQFPGGSYSSGSGQSGTNAVISFPSPGNYNVRLWQLDSVNACFDTTTQNVTVITQHCDTIPKLSFNYSPIDSAHLQTIHFNCSDSDAIQNWNFNYVLDPTFQVYVHANNPVYTFPYPGLKYVVCVDEPAIQGCPQQACDWINVNTSTMDTTLCNSINLSYTYSKNATNRRQVSFNVITNKKISIESWYIYKIDNSYDTITKYYDSAVINAFDPVYNFPDTGVYNVCVIASYDSSCNKEYCNTITIDDVIAGIADTTRGVDNFITSYPNPAHDKVTMNLQLNIPAIVHIDIYNLNGQNVYSSKVGCIKGSNNITIPVPNLPRGQYFIDINNNGQRKRSVFQKF